MDEMDRKTTNQVKQVIMNDLGFTRESIRKIMEEIVEDTFSKHLNNGKMIDIIDKFILKRIDESMKAQNWFAPGSMKQHIDQKISSILNEFLFKEIKSKLFKHLEVKVEATFGSDCEAQKS